MVGRDCGVYAIRCVPTGQVYVGASTRLGARWALHRNQLARGVHYNSGLLGAWQTYGPEAFCFETLEAVCDGADLRAAELRWIAKLAADDPLRGFNVESREGGRRAEAARNDQRILDAARDVFTANPEAPIATVAERANVGIGALYRRYPSKDALLERLALDGLKRYLVSAEAALADEGDPWTAFADFMRRSLDEGAGSLTLRFAGRFTASAELNRLGRTAHAATQRLLARTKAAGALRFDIEVGDLTLIFEQLQAVQVGDQQRTRQLRHRYLALLLDALRTPTMPTVPGEPLPGPPPRWDEITQRYEG